MSSPEWSSQYETGIEVIDLQHRKIFEALTRLEQSIRIGKSDMWLKQIVGEMERYAKEHFISEEELFVKYAYPKADEHRAAHRRFASEVLTFYPRIEQDRLDALAISGYLKIWIYDHVMKMDMEYKAYFRSIGVI